MNVLKHISLSCCIAGLFSCAEIYSDKTLYTNDNPINSHTLYDASQIFDDNSNATMNEQEVKRQQVKVPDSFHLGASHQPIPHQDLDKKWVNDQNSAGYTIALGESEKASQVASKLYQAPKNARMAQVKYYRNGNPYYQGVYGSYNTYEEAQNALKALPRDLQQTAGIKNWSKVQNAINN